MIAKKMAIKLMQYHPELFECKNRLVSALFDAGYVWMTDYSSIDLCHDVYGLEICGIKNSSDIKNIAKIFKKAFPDWRYMRQWEKGRGSRDEGWLIRIHKIPEPREKA
jgi:hypothetical protein